MFDREARPVALRKVDGGLSREDAIALVNGIREKAGLGPLSAESIAASDARRANRLERARLAKEQSAEGDS